MMAMAAMADPRPSRRTSPDGSGLTKTTLYTYVNGDGTVKAAGKAVLDGSAERAAGPAADG